MEIMENCCVVKIYHQLNCENAWCACNEKEGNQLKIEYFKNNEKIEGIYTSYYYDGFVERKCNYIDGKLNGNCRDYDLNGILCIECNYIDDKIIGVYTEYYNGFVRRECIYIDGKLNGVAKEFNYINRNLAHECNYVDGKLNGSYKVYDDEQNLIMESIFEDGKEIKISPYA